MVKNNNKAARGANRKAGNEPKLTAEEKRTKLARQYGIKPRTKEFVDELLNNKGITQTEAYRRTHPNANNNTARDAAAKLLQKPAVIGYKDSAVGKAKRRVVQLVDSRNESIALKASDSIIDRAEGKAVIKSENTSKVIEVKLDLTGSRIGSHFVMPQQLPAEAE